MGQSCDYDGESQPTPSAVLRQLEEDGVDSLPHINSIKNWIRNRRRDDSTPWSIADENLGDTNPSSVLEVLGWLVGRGIKHVTRDEARVISRIKEVRPELPSAQVWSATRSLIDAHRYDDTVARDEIHAFLARGPEGFAALVDDGLYSGSVAGTAVKTFTVDAEIVGHHTHGSPIKHTVYGEEEHR